MLTVLGIALIGLFLMAAAIWEMRDDTTSGALLMLTSALTFCLAAAFGASL